MNKIKFIVFILFFALSAFAQDFAPSWVEESYRSRHYPKSQWYTGFVEDKIEGQPNSSTYQSIEKAAQNKLSESIVVQVKSSSRVEVSSRQTQKGETINTNYNQNIRTTSDMVLAKVNVESYFDKKTKRIYGFASVKKEDLTDFYRSKINSLFAFADKEFIRLEILVEDGKKNSAFGKIQVIEDSLKNVSYWGSLLQVVKSDNSYIEREQDFWQKLSDAKRALEHGTSIYLNVSGIEDSEGFAERLGAQMQEKQCNCAISENANNVDYVVKVKVKLGNCIENRLNDFGQIYCYANANVSVNNLKYKKPLDIKIPEAKGGWGNRNREKATDEAIKDLISNLAEKIIQSINK